MERILLKAEQPLIKNIMKRALQVLSLLLIITLGACNGPKKLTKKGDQLSTAGIHKEAVEFYMKALNKDRAHVEARIGLKKSGQSVLGDYQSKFFKAYNNSDYKTAVYAYREMETFQKRLSSYNVEIEIPGHYKADFEDAKEKYLKEQFEVANELLSQENFKGAENVFKEITILEPNYGGQNLDNLMEIAKLEPFYRDGNLKLEANKNRAAYYSFKNIVDINPNYKDSKFKMEEALKLAEYPIAVLKFKNFSMDGGSEAQITANFMDDMLRDKGPFVKVLDRSNMDQVLNEQYLSMNGWVSGSGAVKTGELLGAKAILSGKVLKVQKISRNPVAKTVKAYKERLVRTYHKDTDSYTTKTEYDKVTVQNYVGYNEVVVSFQFMLVSSETGEILLSEIVERRVRSEVDYNTYGGNYKELVPGDWKFTWKKLPTDRIETNRNTRRQFHTKFNADKNLRGIMELSNEVYQEVGRTVSQRIKNFNPEN